MRKALRQCAFNAGCISFLLQLGESVQRFFHRGLLLYPSLSYSGSSEMLGLPSFRGRQEKKRKEKDS
jgi:hypothetical protein